METQVRIFGRLGASQILRGPPTRGRNSYRARGTTTDATHRHTDTHTARPRSRSGGCGNAGTTTNPPGTSTATRSP